MWWEEGPYVTTEDGREVTLSLRSSVSIGLPEGLKELLKKDA
jgi:hypothetical protein